MKKAILYLLVFVAIQLVTTYLVMGGWRLVEGEWPQADDSVFLVIASCIYALVAIVLFFRLRWTPLHGRYVEIRPWTVLLWTFLAAVGLVLPSQWLQEQMPELPNLIEQSLEGIMNTLGGYLALGILAPLSEEVVFRGAILRVLLRWTDRVQSSLPARRHWVAIAVSAVLFALVHMNPAQMPHAFLVGLLLGWMYYRTGSIIPGTLLHVVNNTVAYVFYRLYPEADVLADVLGSNGVVLRAVGFSLLILLPALYQLHLHMRRVAAR